VKLDHLFDWPSRHHVHLALPVMLVISAGLHVAGILVFQQTHPRAKTHSERGAKAYFLAPGSAEAAKLAPLLAASDPSLFSPAHPSARDVWKLPETTYTPSFDASSPGLLTALPPSNSVQLPPVSSTGPVTRDFAPAPASRSTLPGSPTSVTFGQEVTGRAVTPPESFSFAVVPADGAKSFEAAKFLVAVSPEGRTLYFFPRQSSGSEVLDRAALRYLAGTRFEASNDAEPAWTTATFHWGADIVRQPAP
jgi:hypothetical protein